MDGRDNRGRRRSRGRNGNNRDGKPRGDFHSRKPGDSHSFDKKSTPVDRPFWTAPVQNTDPLPDLKCIRCGLPITDHHSALSDRHSGEPVHFDCAMAELNGQENLEAGDVLSYIGGGRFGIVHFYNGRSGEKNFSIKKILEWEDKEKRAEWRDAIADHYSIT